MAITQKQKKEIEAAASVPCWSCTTALPGPHFCSSCGKIQPVSSGGDYFAFLEIPRKLTIDPGMLEGKFHMLSWKLHPDNFVRATEFERDLSLNRSSELNDAYRTLREPISRVEYLLLRRGLRKEGTTKQQAPAELLEEVFELNEQLDELREARAEGGDLAALRAPLEAAQKSFQEKLREVDAELAQIGQEWDAALDAAADEANQQALLSRMNVALNRRSYIRNLVAGVQKELTEA
jgi:molecular chaperone HscB